MDVASDKRLTQVFKLSARSIFSFCKLHDPSIQLSNMSLDIVMFSISVLTILYGPV